ncbi:hypothetical protein [Bacillus wiedmannii]
MFLVGFVYRGIITSAKALANTAYRLITEEGLLEKVKEEFREVGVVG